MILYGSISIFGAANSTPGTASSIASTSRCDRPSDFLRISSSSSGLNVLRADDDVARAEPLDQRERLLLRAGADRQHRDHRADAEHHAEHRQRRAQLVLARGSRGAVDERVEQAPHRLGADVRRCRCRAAIAVRRRIAQRDLVAGGEPGLDDDASRGRRAELDRRPARSPCLGSLRYTTFLPSLLTTACARHDERVLLIEHERAAHALAGLHHRRGRSCRAAMTTAKYCTGSPVTRGFASLSTSRILPV